MGKRACIVALFSKNMSGQYMGSGEAHDVSLSKPLLTLSGLYSVCYLVLGSESFHGI